MRLLRHAIFVSVLAATTAGAQALIPVTAARNTAVLASNETAVTVHGWVTAFSGWKNSFFLQDATGAISVDRLENAPLRVGDEVEVVGQVKRGLYANILVSKATQVLGHGGALPKAPAATYLELQTGEFDSSLVTVTGTVHAARMGEMWGRRMLFLDVRTGNATLTAYVLNYPASDLGYLVDDQVQIKGVCGTIFNGRRQLMGIRLFVPALDDVEVLAKGQDLGTIPVSPLDSLLTLHGPALDHRVHVRGTITYEDPGREVFLQQGEAAIRILRPRDGPWTVGMQAEAWGFLEDTGQSATLENGLLGILGPGQRIVPKKIKASDVIKLEDGFVQAPNDSLLVELEATIQDRLPNTGSPAWTLEADGVRFQAQIASGPRDWALRFESGTHVILTGVCMTEADPFRTLKSFHIRLRSPEDMRVVRAPYLNQSLWVLLALYVAISVGSLLIYLVQARQDGEADPKLRRACRRISGVLALTALLLAMIRLFFASPEQVPVASALSMFVIGCSILLARSKRFAGAGQVLAVIVAFTAMLKLAGVLYGLEGANGLAAHLIISTPMAVNLLLLSLASLFSTPGSGLMKTVCSPRLGGVMLRRVVPAAVIAPLLVGWVRWQLQVFGLVDTRFGLTLFAISNALIFSFLVWSSAAILNRLDGAKSSAEEAVSGRQKKLDLIFDTGAMGDYTWDVEPDLVTAHSSVWRMYGETEAHVSEPAAWFHARQHPDDHARIAEELRATAEERRPFDLEFRVVWPDSSIRWLYCRAVATFDEAGRLVQTSGFNLDVTGRKTAELNLKRTSDELAALNQTLEKRVEQRSHELMQAERRYRMIVESVQDYAIYQLDGNGNVASWNVGAERLKGYLAEEIVGRHFSIFYPQAEIEQGHPQRHLEAAAKGEAVFHEAQRVRKDGSLFWASISINAIYDEGEEICGFSKVVREITERRRAEERLVERAEEAKRAKSSFLAAISHEIRTPMNAILGMADLLWETPLNTIQRDYVGRFRRAGVNLLTLINGILDLSKIESGRFDLDAVDFDLMELADRAMEIAAESAGLKQLSLESQVEPETPVSLVGDPVRLQQVLNHLLGNAIKFTPTGKITLWIGPHKDGLAGHLVFSVRDTGIGIAEQQLTTIFEDFTQAESSATRRFGGTGLGLGICQRIVKKMKGELTVESVAGRGSTFRFDAHVEIGAGAKENQAPAFGNLAGRQVLVVDDNPTNRLILCEMCAGWGMVSTAAASVADAETALRNTRHLGETFSLILLDRVLPGMEGFQALRQIKDLDRKTPVIITSSDNQPRDVTEAKALGAAAYLMKPVRRNELLFNIQAALTACKALRKILLVEDSEDNRFLVEAYLAGKPYKLSFAENGLEGLETFRRETFDLILMDIQMPVMDGLTATVKIRELEKERAQHPTAIIAVSANALVEDYQRSLDAGCNEHLAKPISQDRLIGAIERFS